MSIPLVILAGGKGMRLHEETNLVPKPMVDINGVPLIEIIIRGYENQGISEFVVCGGYKFEILKDYCESRKGLAKIEVVDTGSPDSVGTAGRLRQVKSLLGSDFLVTYGDSISNVSVSGIKKVHDLEKRFCTLTVINPRLPFGLVEIGEANQVVSFREKPLMSSLYTNGGLFLMRADALGYIENDSEMLEVGPLQRMIADGQVSAFKHEGFRVSIDTYKDLISAREYFKENS